jgi:hypothetical protein
MRYKRKSLVTKQKEPHAANKHKYIVACCLLHGQAIHSRLMRTSSIWDDPTVSCSVNSHEGFSTKTAHFQAVWEGCQDAEESTVCASQ